MRNNRSLAALGLAALAVLATSCDTRDAAEPTAAPAPAPAAEVAVVPTKADVADKAALQAGLAAMEPRITERVEPFTPVRAMEDGRLLLHPADNGEAKLVFNVEGVESVQLAPMIEAFASNKDCTGSPQAGVVEFSYALDDQPATSITVDRNYAALIPLATAGRSRLTLTSAAGNGVTWCDWFAIGFTDARVAAGSAAPAADAAVQPPAEQVPPADGSVAGG